MIPLALGAAAAIEATAAVVVVMVEVAVRLSGKPSHTALRTDQEMERTTTVQKIHRMTMRRPGINPGAIPSPCRRLLVSEGLGRVGEIYMSVQGEDEALLGLYIVNLLRRCVVVKLKWGAKSTWTYSSLENDDGRHRFLRSSAPASAANRNFYVPRGRVLCRRQTKFCPPTWAAFAPFSVS